MNAGQGVTEEMGSCSPATEGTEWGEVSASGSGAIWASPGAFSWGPISPGQCFSNEYSIYVPPYAPAGDYQIVWILTCSYDNPGPPPSSGACAPPSEIFQEVDITVVSTTQAPPFPSSGTDNQGAVSPPATIAFPNTLVLSDGSKIELQPGETVQWESPAEFSLNCNGVSGCAASLWNFVSNYLREPVLSDSGVAMVAAVRGLNLSLAFKAGQAVVEVYDGAALVTTMESNSSFPLSGAQGVYSQEVSVQGNETVPEIAANVTTTFSHIPSPCQSGAVSFNSGNPIEGNLTGTSGIEFCVSAGQTTTVQFSVPPALQNLTTLYSFASNSSRLSVKATGSSSSGANPSGYMTTIGLFAQMPFPLASPSGDDRVSVSVNNTGSSTAVALLQLQLFPKATSSTTTTTTVMSATTASNSQNTSSSATSTAPSTSAMSTATSSAASSTTSPPGPVPEFPYQGFTVVAVGALIAGAYLLVRFRTRLEKGLE